MTSSPAGRSRPTLSDGSPVPAVAHVPGSGTVPDRERLARLGAGVPALRAALASGQVPAAFDDGCVLYAVGAYWEAHELWEPVWTAARPNSRERWLLVALIALANACLKIEMGRRSAAVRLLRQALGALGECGAAQRSQPLLGLDAATLGRSAAGFAERVAAAGPRCDVTLNRLRPPLVQPSAES